MEELKDIESEIVKVRLKEEWTWPPFTRVDEFVTVSI